MNDRCDGGGGRRVVGRARGAARKWEELTEPLLREGGEGGLRAVPLRAVARKVTLRKQ